jgi:hypothetical protein
LKRVDVIPNASNDQSGGSSGEQIRLAHLILPCALPVVWMNAEAFNGTICDLLSSRTRAGRSVIALARRLDSNSVLFRLSRNRAGLPSISSAPIRFSSSSALGYTA